MERRGIGATVALALAAGVASRVLVLAVAFLAAGPAGSDPDPSHWNRSDTVLAPLLRWDAGFYLEIAERGYSREPHGGGATTLGFFPGYPLAVRGVAAATGLGAPAAAVLWSTLCFLAALAVIAAQVADQYGARTARRSVLLLAFLPWSAFASFPYTEAMFLLLAALAVLLLDRGRPWLAAVPAAAATATRMAGLALVVAIAFELWRTRSRRPSDWLAPIAALAGIGAFALYLGLAFGDPLAFSRAIDQPAWKRSPWAAPGVILLAPLKSVYHLIDGRAAIGDLDIWILIGASALLLAERKRLPPSWIVFAAVGMLLPIGSGSIGSIGRYLVPLFPVPVALALRLERGGRTVTALTLALSAVGLAVITVRYARWLWES